MFLLERGRAELAYQFVESACRNLKPQEKKEYKSHVKKTANMIHTNGLGLTIAFLFSKVKKPSYGLIYKQIDEYLCSNNTSRIKKKENTELMHWVTKLGSREYRLVELETLSLFKWLKRFVDGMIEGEAEDV